jgi:hypothetical protein
LTEVQRLELLELGQMFQPRVRHLGEVKAHADTWLAIRLQVAGDAAAQLLDGLYRLIRGLVGVIIPAQDGLAISAALRPKFLSSHPDRPRRADFHWD